MKYSYLVEADDMPLFYLDGEYSLFDILVRTKFFTSKNEARKNWNRTTDLKDGWNEFFRIGKLKRNLYIHRGAPTPKVYLEPKITPWNA